MNKEKSSAKILAQYPTHSFKNTEEFQKHLRALPKEGFFIDDYVAIDDIVYTMDEYDMDGQEISYYNKRTGLGFKLWTSNRYKNGLFDSEVSEPYEVGCWRNDINYAD